MTLYVKTYIEECIQNALDSHFVASAQSEERRGKEDTAGSLSTDDGMPLPTEVSFKLVSCIMPYSSTRNAGLTHKQFI